MRDFDPFGFTEEENEEMERMFKEKGEKALKEDPFYNPTLRKKAKKESKSKKAFESYNWTTHKKKIAGLKAKIKELKAIENPSEKEEYTLKRLQNLLSWHSWALKHHEAGKSDKWIHNETQKRKEAKK